jgi:hypothetical protein
LGEIIADELESPGPGAGISISYQGVRFSLDPALAAGAQGRTVVMDDSSLLFAFPEHVAFSFEGYPQTQSEHEPVLRVYTVSDYERVNPVATDLVQELEMLLRGKPSLPREVPILPVMNAAQLIHARVEYLAFGGGEGVGFLTQFGQDAWPINDQGLVYVFQGLTDDHERYISGIFPIGTDLLPDDAAEALDGEFNAFGDAFRVYSQGIEIMLDASPGDAFSPDLSLLLALLRSITIE